MSHPSTPAGAPSRPAAPRAARRPLRPVPWPGPARRWLLAAVIAPFVPPILGAQTVASPAPAAGPALDARARAEVIDAIGAQLARRYVDADTARRIADALRARLRAGAYDSIAAAPRFAEVVTRDMRSVNGDLHLGLRWEPRNAVAIRERDAREPQPGGARRVAVATSAPRVAAPPPSAPPAADPYAVEARRLNFGLAKVEILPLNVGYLAIDAFMGADGVDSVVADAMRFLQRTDAIIIDVRRNRGGSGEMSHYVFSHFLPAQPVPTIRVVNRGEGDTTVMHSVAEVAGPRRPDVPLYVLTSQGTGSAAEEFSFVLKNLGRATIVGDRTAGAGHMVRAVDVGHGFVASVSITRVTDARSNLEWERVGVQPDVRVAPERALDVAYAAALRTLAAKTTDAGRRTFLARSAETLDAQLRAERPDAARVAGFAGTYDGDRLVRVDDGRLWFHRRAGVMGEELVPLGGDRFALQGATWVTFETSGGAARMLVDRPDGTRATYLKTANAATPASAPDARR